MYSVRHSDGTGGRGPDDLPGRESSLSALYDELDRADQEHGDVSLKHLESGWWISAHRDGRVVMEHLDIGSPRHMIPVSKARTLELWRRLIDGDFAALEAEPWRPGYL